MPIVSDTRILYFDTLFNEHDNIIHQKLLLKFKVAQYAKFQ